jgi:hypothetical protein
MFVPLSSPHVVPFGGGDAGNPIPIDSLDLVSPPVPPKIYIYSTSNTTFFDKPGACAMSSVPSIETGGDGGTYRVSRCTIVFS